MDSISIYGSHDASFCFRLAGSHYQIYEMERLHKKRYCRINETTEQFRESCLQVKHLMSKHHDKRGFDVCYHSQLSIWQLEVVKEVFGITRFKEVHHHISHAASTLYQSPFNDCLIVSFDGGGFDEDGVSTFNIYKANKERHEINRIAKIYSKRTEDDQEKDGYPSKNLPLDMGNTYSLFAVPIREIKKDDDWNKSFLAFAGKIMGLVAYGKAREEWLEPIKNFYYKGFYSGKLDLLEKLGEEIGLRLGVNTIEGKDAYDLAATSQQAFEEIFMEEIAPYLEKYPDLPICLTGGCALNVLLNERLRRELKREIYVAPNPSDCGLSLGMMLINQPPQDPTIDVTYNGFPILDFEQLDHYVKKHQGSPVNIDRIAELLAHGKIIGFMRKDSECGPRSLGNRSILCDPSAPNMKKVLNDKVKHREWFRPFAPVVREENVGRYFEFEGRSPYMSFAPKVKDEWKTKLQSITHEDGTARVQTVSRKQNEFLYDLLEKFESKKGFDVLLNTSFNIKGNPILTTIEDALHVLHTTELDFVIVEKTCVNHIVHKSYVPKMMLPYDEHGEPMLDENGNHTEREMIEYVEEHETQIYYKYYIFGK